VAKALTKQDRQNLAKHETTIANGLQTFVDVGQALHAIRFGMLYRESYETFEQYCAERWDVTSRRAEQLMRASDAAVKLRTIVRVEPPTRESHVRPLLNVPEQHRAEVWQAVLAAAPKDEGGRPVITGLLVERAVDAWHDSRKAESLPKAESGKLKAEDEAGERADVIDVESRPLGKAESGELKAEEEEAEDGQEWECPECGCHEIAEDLEGRYCSKCKADVESDPVNEQLSAEDEFLAWIDQRGRELFAGRMAVGAARLESLAGAWMDE